MSNECHYCGKPVDIPMEGANHLLDKESTYHYECMQKSFRDFTPEEIEKSKRLCSEKI